MVLTGRIMGRKDFFHTLEFFRDTLESRSRIWLSADRPFLGVARFLGTATTRRIWSDRGRILRFGDHETEDLRHTCRYRLS